MQLKDYLKSLERANGCNRFALEYKLYRNVPCKFIYACRFNKRDKKPIWKLVWRETYNGKKWWNSDLYYGRMCGWRVFWNKKWSNYLYREVEPLNTLEKYEGNLSPGMCIDEILTSDDDIRKLFPILKYFEKFPKYDLFNFMHKLEKFPMLEVVYKNPLIHYLYNNTNIYKMSGNKRNIFLKWVKDNEDYVKRCKPSYPEISYRCMHNCSKEDYENYLDRNWCAKLFKTFTKNKDLLFNVAKYLKKQGHFDYRSKYEYIVQIYGDYLSMCKELEMNMEDYGVWFPKNLKQRHDNVSATLNRIKEERLRKEKEEKAKKLNDSWSKYINSHKELYAISCEQDDLKVVVPQSSMDMVNVGQELNICVGSMGYDQKMLDKKCYIAFVYHGNVPVECCELDQKLNIVQLRGQHNSTEGEYHSKAKGLIESFVQMFKQANMQLGGAC